MSKIKNINIQLDPNKTREKKIIDLLEHVKQVDGVAHKEFILKALESQNDVILTELKEMKQILLIALNQKNDTQILNKTAEAPAPAKKDRLIKINVTNDDISKDDLKGF